VLAQARFPKADSAPAFVEGGTPSDDELHALLQRDGRGDDADLRAPDAAMRECVFQGIPGTHLSRSRTAFQLMTDSVRG